MLLLANLSFFSQFFSRYSDFEAYKIAQFTAILGNCVWKQMVKKQEIIDYGYRLL